MDEANALPSASPSPISSIKVTTEVRPSQYDTGGSLKQIVDTIETQEEEQEE